MDDIKEIYLKEQERLKRTDFFSTGFEELDVFCKYIDKENIITIGGRPAMGKTNFSVSLINHMVNADKNVLCFVMDCTKSKFVMRLVSEKIGTPLFSLLEGKVREEEVNIVLDTYKYKKLKIIDKTNLSIEDIDTKVQEIKPDIVFIDYVQLIEAPKAPNRTEAINLVIKELKWIAVENSVIVVLLSQLSRAVEGRLDKHPLLSDLRNGSLLEDISDIVLFVYREEYYSAEMENPSNEIIVAKNSMGPVGIISLDFKHGFFKNKIIDNTF